MAWKTLYPTYAAKPASLGTATSGWSLEEIGSPPDVEKLSIEKELLLAIAEGNRVFFDILVKFWVSSHEV